MVINSKDVTNFKDAFSRLADGLTEQAPIKVGSFWEFVRDVWSVGYDHPEYFKAWHVGLICEDVEEAIQEGLNYVAVLPRFHFKSTILGHAFSIWRLLQSTRDQSVLYLSYSDGMAKYHIQEINKAVNRNPIIKGWMKNRSPKADYSFRYHVGTNKPVEIMHGGLFSFKRGMHVNGALVADDILRDPENPLNIGQVTKVEEHFLTESMFIPLKGVPVIVLGTPMLPGDILTKLQSDDRFKSRVLPALDPAPNRRVLMPELYSEEWLVTQQKARPKSFASEFMLIPHFSTEAYFNEEEIIECEDASLKNASAVLPYETTNDIYAGFDVGKKRHPSHLVIFEQDGDTLKQIHQSFLEGWSYSDQIEYLNSVVTNFKLTKGYIDNTRGELEDRGLNRAWLPLTFSQKSKMTMAQIFEQFVHDKRVKLLRDERQTQQILSVNNELKAPDTPMGHGDAFFSIAMALQAAHESQGLYTLLGSASEWLDAVSPNVNAESTPEVDEIIDMKSQGTDKLQRDDRGLPIFDFSKRINEDLTDADRPKADCDVYECQPYFWVPERKLCLYCGHRG
tara:strand:- start:592 stop:2283 length:1692 start_codon:yes stop_codon:yes gene_type:complete